MVSMNKLYYAIIPANVRYDTDLKANAKLLYGEITALCNEKGYCWASNSYFAELYKVSNETISRWISQLIKKGYLNSQIIYKVGTKKIEERRLYISKTPIDKKSIPLVKKVMMVLTKRSIIIINIIINMIVICIYVKKNQ